MTKLVLECEQLKQHSQGSEVENLKCALQHAKGKFGKTCLNRSKNLIMLCGEKDNELESLRKQLETKSDVPT